MLFIIGWKKKGNIKVQSLVDKPAALGNFLTIQKLLLLLHLGARRGREVWKQHTLISSPGKHPGHIKYAFIPCLFVVAVVVAVVGEKGKLNRMTELLPGARDRAERPECRTS